ncbi:MAG: hypothetical protein U0M50_05495 [Paramuribaculum sp.]
MKRYIMTAVALIMSMMTVVAQKPEKHLEGVDITLGESVRYCGGVMVDFKFTNSSDKTYYLAFPGDGVAIDKSGKKHKTRVMNLVFDYPNHYCLHAGSTVCGSVYIKDVSETTRNIKLLDIAFSCSDLGTVEGKCSYHFSDIAISPRSNTDDDRVTCDLPDLFISPVSCLRAGSNVEMTFILTNKGRLDSNSDAISHNIFDRNGEAVASDGTKYRARLRYAADDESIEYDFPKDVPVKMRLVIEDVPQNVTRFQLIRYKTTPKNLPFRIDFRNMSIGWQRDRQAASDSQN